MSARRLAVICAALASSVGSLARAADTAVPVLTAGQVVAVAPLFVEPFDPDRDRAFALTDALEAHLTERGLTVVSAREFETFSTPKISEVGGYFDPYSGERIEEKYRQVRDHVYAKLAEAHRVDAYLYPRVVVVEALLKGTSAEWDGTKVVVMQGLMNWLQNNASSRAIDGLTLLTTVRDAADVTLGEGRGGLQLLVRHGKQGFESLGADEVLRDTVANQRAIAIALKDLVPAKPQP